MITAYTIVDNWEMLEQWLQIFLIDPDRYLYPYLEYLFAKYNPEKCICAFFDNYDEYWPATDRRSLIKYAKEFNNSNLLEYLEIY